jgi:16S rRNA (uracil1498-N3)-methyltransferase
MRRFYLPPEQCQEGTLWLTGDAAHHAVDVLRLRRGEMVLVLNGAGAAFLCRTEDAHRDRVRLSVQQRHPLPPPPCRVTLVQALPKGPAFDSIIRSATELGVARIVPLLAERVVARLAGAQALDKAEKWQRAAVEAIKQCGLGWLPVVEPPVTLKDWLARRELFDLPLLASLQTGSRHPRHYFDAFLAQFGHPPRTACVWVGPEGDFTPMETVAIRAAGGLPMTLGPNVLRVDTAATYCLSVLNYELTARLGDAGSAPGIGVPGTGDE